VFRFIYGECFGESCDCAFSRNVGGRVELTHCSNKTGQVDDVPFGFAQMWQRELASCKDADEIQVQ
jgi:hypothetical protein